jgi:ABC-type tungstate transport system permease subunit
MSDFSTAFKLAFQLLVSFDVDLRAIVLLSLEVSPDGQKAIADYKINGEQLFYPNANDSIG